jgi:hypothetical protein
VLEGEDILLLGELNGSRDAHDAIEEEYIATALVRAEPTLRPLGWEWVFF